MQLELSTRQRWRRAVRFAVQFPCFRWTAIPLCSCTTGPCICQLTTQRGVTVPRYWSTTLSVSPAMWLQITTLQTRLHWRAYRLRWIIDSCWFIHISKVFSNAISYLFKEYCEAVDKTSVDTSRRWPLYYCRACDIVLGINRDIVHKNTQLIIRTKLNFLWHMFV